MLQPDSVQQLLIIVIPKETVAEMIGQLPIQLLRTSPVFIPAESTTRVPERQPLPQQGFQLHSEPASRSRLVL